MVCSLLKRDKNCLNKYLITISKLSRISSKTQTLVSFSGRFPVLCADDGQANLALLIDIGVVDFCFEADLRRFERVLCWKVNLYLEGTFVVWGILLRSVRHK